MMERTRSQTLAVDDAYGRRRLAVLTTAGDGPGVVWMQGFKSDMVSTKAAALAEWAEREGVALTRFDYSGHGQSEGAFEAGTIGQWLADSRAVFQAFAHGPQIVVGSSMGGYLAMLLEGQLAQLPQGAGRIAALVLIAPAWDMTEELMWKSFPDDVRRALLRDGTWLRPSQYGDPYPITRALIEEGRSHLIGGGPWRPTCPVHIIHGRLDPDVPFAHSERLRAMAGGGEVQLTEVPDGEHRLSRPEDIALLIRTIERIRAAVR